MRYRSLIRVTEPTVEPVTVAEAKAHLRVEHSADDNLISDYIKAAREYVEEYLDVTLMLTQWRMKIDIFAPVIQLPRPSMATAAGYTDVTLTYTTEQNAVQTLPNNEYRIDRDTKPGELRPTYAASWPSHRADYNSISVTWWAGYGAAGSDVPQRIRHAVLLLVTHLYENRSAVAVGANANSKPLEFALKTLLDSSRWGGYL